jgi:transposase InsO family protein
MNREVHVRFCEGPRAKLPRPTHRYVAIAVGFVYVAVILDAWSRRVVGYAISRSIDARLTIAALKSAVERRNPSPGCVHHSDSQWINASFRAAWL